MGFIFNGLKATVTLNGSTGIPYNVSGQVTKYVVGTIAANNVYQTIYTPTAGKTFYATDIIIQGGVATTFYFGDTTQDCIGLKNDSVTFTGIPLRTPLAFTNAHPMQIKTASNNTCIYSIVGFEA